MLADETPGNVEAVFADSVAYYEFGNMSLDQVRADLRRDHDKWPVRTFSIAGEIRHEQVSDATWRLSFPVDYTLLNRKQQPRSGSLKIVITCEEPDLRITSVKRETVSARKPK